MGEYIKYKDEDVKLGTCESLYYVRLDQLKEARLLMEKKPGNLDVSGYLDPKNSFRYRFPFPEEDNVEIGDFGPYDKGLVIALHPDDWSLADFDHTHMWHSCQPATGGYNVNVSFPCPQDAKINKCQHSPITWHIIAIKQQKQIDGEVWTVIGCPYCGSMARIPRAE